MAPMRAKKRKRPAVGYGKPPVHTRFKKGQSGNPRGRPKGSRNRLAPRLAVDELVRIMESKRSSPSLKVKVAKTILDLAMLGGGRIAQFSRPSGGARRKLTARRHCKPDMRRTARRRAWKSNPRYRGLKPWKKGQSGNPRGRPKGSRNKVNPRLPMDKLIKLMESKRAPPVVQLRAARMFIEVMMRAAGLWEK